MHALAFARVLACLHFQATVLRQKLRSNRKKKVWTSQWSVILRTFYRQILSLLYSFFFLKLPPPARPGTTCIGKKQLWPVTMKNTTQRSAFQVSKYLYPIGSMYGMFAYISSSFMLKVIQYTRYGSYGSMALTSTPCTQNNILSNIPNASSQHTAPISENH